MILDACIFDLNGTVLDDEGVYAESFRAVLKKLGVEVKDKYPHVLGIGVKENWPRLKSKYNFKTKKTFEELARETQNEYLKRLHEVTTTDGFEKFVSDIRSTDIPTALATSNDWWMCEEVLEKFNLEEYFDVVTTGEEVGHKKPNPDLFLTTADKLGVSRSGCLVFEDAEAGVTAALRAGMKVVGVVTDPDKEKMLEDASFIIGDFTKITPGLIKTI
ncbi:HAD family phosphatase [Candidatus Woesebacteria bacterium]|nr:HAD family phosphatase [Candidatus Woesebacteria bacterium]